MTELHMYTNGYDYVIASNVEEACEYANLEMGETLTSQELDFSIEPDDSMFVMWFHDEPDPSDYPADSIINEGEEIPDEDLREGGFVWTAESTVAEWVKNSGAGYLACTEY